MPINSCNSQCTLSTNFRAFVLGLRESLIPICLVFIVHLAIDCTFNLVLKMLVRINLYPQYANVHLAEEKEWKSPHDQSEVLLL